MIAVLTDFHNSDCLGVAKGAMKTVKRDAEIIDLCNHVALFHVMSGAWILLQDYKYFPKSTVFYCVVDPGVGSSRKAIAVKTKNYFFVGPDNGLIYPAAAADKIEKIVELPIPETASKTFHGRDVFAPAAAKLDKGIAIEELGTELSRLQQLGIGSSDGSGEVVLVEHYGNVVTNIPAGSPKNTYEVECGSFKKNLKRYATFSDATERELFVIEGSRKTLEISIKEGVAVAAIGCKVGDKITIK